MKRLSAVLIGLALCACLFQARVQADEKVRIGFPLQSILPT